MDMTLVAQPGSRSLRWLYAALVVFGAIAAHLCSEFAGMGADSGAIAFSSRHLYLALAALAALAVAVREISGFVGAAANGRDRKRLAEMSLATLPWRGGRRFVLFTALLQFGIGGLTEIGEGCPLCGHDIGAGVVGAVVGALLLALATRLLARRLPAAASALFAFFRQIDRPTADGMRRALARPIVVDDLLWFARLFNRPPPALQS